VKDHLLFLLFTKSAAPPKSAAPVHCPPPPSCRGPAPPGDPSWLRAWFECFSRPTTTLSKGFHINVERAVTKAKHTA